MYKISLDKIIEYAENDIPKDIKRDECIIFVNDFVGEVGERYMQIKLPDNKVLIMDTKEESYIFEVRFKRSSTGWKFIEVKGEILGLHENYGSRAVQSENIDLDDIEGFDKYFS